MTHRELAEALRQLQQEKERRVQRENDEQARVLSDAEDQARRELDSFAVKRRELEEKLRREKEEIRNLKAQAADADEMARREQQLIDLQKRIIEFQGNDNESLRERLIREGWSEEVVFDTLKRRTLEQTLERPGGMPARFVPRDDTNALEKLMEGVVKPDDLKNREVLYAIKDLREEASAKGYLSPDKQEQLERVSYLSQKFEQNELYKENDQNQYFSRVRDAAEEVRKGLGLEGNTSTLMYGGRRNRDT